ncbi:MAG: glycosyltransferase family 2 protein [Bacilli bacterium]|nr:glycosyltransferase family 2 protein [Bacilli bacterium]
MKVSVIIPAYNAENFIRKSLDSVVNQVYKNLEIIVVDDASTDSTKKIIKEYADKDDRIIPFYQASNKGVSSARNIGLKAVSGEYVVFVDSDDELTPDAIRRMVDMADKYNSDFIDSYHLLYLKKKNGKLYSFTEKKMPKQIQVFGSLNENVKVLDTYTYITGKLIKKELLKGLKFDETLTRYEDLVFEHELKTRIKNYVLLNKPIYFYYQREDSLVNTLGKKHLCYLEALKKVKNIYSKYNKEVKDTIEALLFQNMILTLFTKVIKNEDSLKENTNLALQTINELIDIFPEYKNNNKINIYIKKKIDVFLNNEQKLEKFIKKINKINFINIYFNYMIIFNKYILKNPLD